MRDTTAVPDCDCFWPKRALDDEWFPVTFDSQMGEYRLILDCGEMGPGYAAMHFCPWCGGALPKSKRGDFFTTPTEEDRNEVAQKMQGVDTSEQMMAVLGPPSETCDNPIETQFTYVDRWESLRLVVHERKRLLSYSISGKFVHSDTPSTEEE